MAKPDELIAAIAVFGDDLKNGFGLIKTGIEDVAGKLGQAASDDPAIADAITRLTDLRTAVDGQMNDIETTIGGLVNPPLTADNFPTNEAASPQTSEPQPTHPDGTRIPTPDAGVVTQGEPGAS